MPVKGFFRPSGAPCRTRLFPWLAPWATFSRPSGADAHESYQQNVETPVAGFLRRRGPAAGGADAGPAEVSHPRKQTGKGRHRSLHVDQSTGIVGKLRAVSIQQTPCWSHLSRASAAQHPVQPDGAGSARTHRHARHVARKEPALAGQTNGGLDGGNLRVPVSYTHLRAHET